MRLRLPERKYHARKTINPDYEPGEKVDRRRPKDEPWIAVRFLDSSDRKPNHYVHSTYTSTLGFALATLWTVACAAYYLFVVIIDALRADDLGDGQRVALKLLAAVVGLYFARKVYQRIAPPKIEAAATEPEPEPPAEPVVEPEPEPAATEPMPGPAMAPAP